jgi:hypothetical protein
MNNLAKKALEVLRDGETREQRYAKERIAELMYALTEMLQSVHWKSRALAPGEGLSHAASCHRPIGWHPEVGAPVTVSIGSDSYADMITAVSKTGRSFATAKHGYFRLDKYAVWKRGHYSAHIGFAETQLDPSF